MKVICSLLLFAPCLSALLISCCEYFLITVQLSADGAVFFYAPPPLPPYNMSYAGSKGDFFMRTEDEILALIIAYEEDLAALLANPPYQPQQELLILGLTEKLEVLFWLLGQNPPAVIKHTRPTFYN